MSTESPDPLARLRQAVEAHQANQVAIDEQAKKLAEARAKQAQGGASK